MNPAKHLQTLGRLCLAVAGLLLANFVSAQSAATGSIEGRVINAGTGGYLTNARVTIEGTSKETFTDSYGQYRLTDVPAGEAKVRVFYTGLTSQLVPTTVAAGQVASLDVTLSAASGEVIQLEAFKVASKVEMEAAAIAINEQRFAATVKNVVSTDAFGDITEGNLGDFVKFLPGVTIDYVSPDARTISVRGVPANYTPVTLNGNRIASANSSTAGRTFELEQISINNAGRIEVLKSRSPETAADALGGAINLVPRSSFEQSKPSFAYRAFVSANGDEKEIGKTRGPTNEASHKIKGGFDFVYINPVSKRFGFTLALLESNIYYPQHRTMPNWAPNAATAVGPVADPEHPYLRSYQVQDGPKNNQRKSISGTIDLRLPNNDIVTVGAQWNYYNASFSNRPVTYDTGGTAPVSFGPDFVNGAIGRGSVVLGGTSFRHKYGYTYAADTTYKHNGPVWKIDGGLAFSHATNHYHDGQDGHFNGVTLTLRGLPNSTTYNNLTPTVNFAGIDKGSYLYPTSIKVLDANGVNPIDLSNASNYNITNVNYNPADSADVFKTARINAKRDLGLSFPFTIKSGLNVQEETRDIRLDNRGNWNFVGPDGVVNTADDNAGLYKLSDPQYSSGPFLFGTPQVPYPDAYSAQTLFNQHPEYFRLASDANPIINSVTNSKYFREVITAVYLMGDMRLLANNRLRISGGVRFERTQDTGYGALINPAAGYIRNSAGQLVLNPDLVARANAQYKSRGDKRDQTYEGYYPSIDASYNVTHNIIARFAYARSIGRPDLSNIIPSTTLPDLNASGPYNITTINASLKPTQVNAYDVSLEYYFAKTGVFSVGAFQKDFSDFVGSAAAQPATVDLLNQLGVPDAQSYVTAGATVTTRFNVGTARVTGVEFNYSQVLDADFMPKWARNFVVYANGQQMHLEGSTLADFSNFIPASGSWGVKYNAGKFSAQVNWNYRGRQRLAAQTITYNGVGHTDRGFYDYFKPRIYTDVNFNYLFSKKIGVFLNARNLTNVAQDAQRYGPTTPSWARTYRREEFGVQYTLGIKGTF
jgi:iron complex outermembrane receptor protein